jgi:hypothetical protein
VADEKLLVDLDEFRIFMRSFSGEDGKMPKIKKKLKNQPSVIEIFRKKKPSP